MLKTAPIGFTVYLFDFDVKLFCTHSFLRVENRHRNFSGLVDDEALMVIHEFFMFQIIGQCDTEIVVYSFVAIIFD